MTRQEKGLLAAVVVLTISVVVLGSMVYRGFQPARNDADTTGMDNTDDTSRIAAVIGGESISEQEWVTELKKRYGTNTLLEMLNRKAITLEAKQRGIQVTQDEIDDKLSRQMQGYESPEAYYGEMQSQFGLSRDDLRIEAVYRLSLEKIATLDIRVDDREIDRYLEEHAADFQPHKQMNLSWIKLSKVSDAERVMTKLEQGQSFEELATTYSVDEFSKDLGGELGWLDEGDPFISEQVMSAVKSLSPGDIAGPISLDEGFAIVYVKGVRTDGETNPKKIREAVREELALQQAGPLDQLEESLRTKYGARLVEDQPSS